MEAEKSLTREQAKASGLKLYQAKNPCPKGHGTDRMVSNGGCPQCNRDRSSAARIRYKQDPKRTKEIADYMREYRKQYDAKPECRDRRNMLARNRAKLDPKHKERKARNAAAKYARTMADPVKREQYKLRQREHAKRRQSSKDFVSKSNEYCKSYWKRRRAENPESMMHCKIRQLVSRVLNASDASKAKPSIALVGYTPDQLREHLESWFIDGMSWSNRGEWEIDHVISVAEFIRLGITDPAKINALSNLRPVWKEHNRAKGDGFALVMPA